jgi:serine/threonine protein kinase
MKPISEAALDHLRSVLDWPDLGGTKYEVAEKLGEGGMGTVYRARDRELDRDVALKVTRGAETVPGSVARMMEEARILARLEHPGIVPIHDIGTLPDGRLFFVMKLVRGQRLDEFARTASSISERLLLFTKICEAVSFAHGHGFIHRDLKPANIMVGPFGEVLVMDWGVAKRLAPRIETNGPPIARVHSQPGHTSVGTVVGTPGFMSPEQERGAVDEVDERTDVYALGAILRALIAEKPLDDADSNESMLPPALAAICSRALAQARADRYVTVSELSDDVIRYLSGMRVQAHRETMWDAAKRLAVRNKLALGVIVAYVVMRIFLLIVTRH